MKKLVILLALIPFCANALCLHFYFDKYGQSHAVRCGTKIPEAQCSREEYWDGMACRKIEIIQSCKAQGGQWKEAQLRVPDGKNTSGRRDFIYLCECPNKKVWDRKKCRSDIPRNKQCTNYMGDGTIRMTQEIFGAANCPRF